MVNLFGKMMKCIVNQQIVRISEYIDECGTYHYPC